MTGYVRGRAHTADLRTVIAAEAVATTQAGRGRLQPQDIADAVLWLATERTRFLVGSILVIDGGETILL